jgi:hypothetical protein
VRRFVSWFVGLTALAVVCSIDPHAYKHLAEARIGRAQADIRMLTKAADDYRSKHGQYPERLRDLADGAYLGPEDSKALNDPWGNEYQYDRNGTRNGGKRPDVWTVSPDGREIGN